MALRHFKKHDFKDVPDNTSCIIVNLGLIILDIVMACVRPSYLIGSLIVTVLLWTTCESEDTDDDSNDKDDEKDGKKK